MVSTTTLQMWFPFERLQEVAYEGLFVCVRTDEGERFAIVVAAGQFVEIAFEKEVMRKRKGFVQWREQRAVLSDETEWLFRFATPQEGSGRLWSIPYFPTQKRAPVRLTWTLPAR